MAKAIEIFLSWLFVFLAAFIVYSTCQVRIHTKGNLENSLQWSPNYSVSLLNHNDRVLGVELNTTEAEDVRTRSIKALKKAPLSDRPFVQLGEASVFLNSEFIDRNLFLETKKRNIRNRRALRILVNLDAKARNFDEAILNLDILLGLNAAKKDIDNYHDALTSLAQNAEGREVINTYLEKQPRWGRTYLSTQINLMTEFNYRDVETALKAYSSVINNSTRVDKLNASYLLKLADLGKINEGFYYWRDLDGSNKTENYTVYNPNFEKRTSLPPFNWQEFNRRKYFSEIDQTGGLYASFADSVVRTLTQQILRLKPGIDYHMNVVAEWSYRRRQGKFYWVVTCLSSEEIISEFYLDDSNKENSGGEVRFHVPAEGCEHQSLKLKAKSGQYSQRIWSRTNALNITQIQ